LGISTVLQLGHPHIDYTVFYNHANYINGTAHERSLRALVSNPIKNPRSSNQESKILELQQKIDDKALELSVNSKKIKALKCPPIDSRNVLKIIVAIAFIAILGFIGFKELIK